MEDGCWPYYIVDRPSVDCLTNVVIASMHACVCVCEGERERERERLVFFHF